MGAPVYNTSFVGNGTRTPKPVLANKQAGTFVDQVYGKYKHMQDQGQKVAEMGTGLYGTYQMMRAEERCARQEDQAPVAPRTSEAAFRKPACRAGD